MTDTTACLCRLYAYIFSIILGSDAGWTRKLATGKRSRVSFRVTKTFGQGRGHGRPWDIILSSSVIATWNLVACSHTVCVLAVAAPGIKVGGGGCSPSPPFPSPSSFPFLFPIPSHALSRPSHFPSPLPSSIPLSPFPTLVFPSLPIPSLSPSLSLPPPGREAAPLNQARGSEGAL